MSDKAGRLRAKLERVRWRAIYKLRSGVIFTHSGGHLSKLGMIRAEVKDGSESADIHG